MTRLLVLAHPRASAALLRRAVAAGDDLPGEAFVLLLAPSMVRALLGRGRSWTAVHARLDALLDDLAAGGVLADGRAAGPSLGKALADLAESFPPDEIVVALPRQRPLLALRVRLALRRASWRSGQPPRVTWLAGGDPVSGG